MSIVNDVTVANDKIYIGGEWVAAEAGSIEDICPTDGSSFAFAPEASVGQMQTAIGAARQAFDDGPWTKMDPADRANCLTQLGETFGAHRSALIELARTEWGCTDDEIGMQIDSATYMATAWAALAMHPVEEWVESFDLSARTLIRHEPLGVVSILTPWNVPHTINAMKVLAALAAGNTLVLKPSPLTPYAGLALARLIDEHTDIPPGVVNVVTTSSLEASQAMVTDPRVDMVSFTGSSAIGKTIMAAAAGTMKRVLLECGGKSASVLLPDIEGLDELLPRLLYEGCTLHAGQACILTSRLLVPESRHSEVVDGLTELARNLRVGDPTDPTVDMGPLISSLQRERVEAHVAGAVDEGARVVAGGKRPPELKAGYFYEPTILDNVEPDSKIAQEEVFGPVLCILSYKDIDQAIEISNNSIYGLSGAVWGTDTEKAIDVARRIRTGQVSVNGVGAGNAPFGGYKESGLGREGGVTGLHQYTEVKGIGAPA